MNVSRAELARVAAEQEWPRLRVWRTIPRVGWAWRITAPDGRRLDGGGADTHAEALAVGLAALETASVPT